MDELRERLKRVQGDIRELGHEVALVGGVAFGLQVRTRTTHDVDLAVAVAGDEQAEVLMRGLHERGYRVVQALEHETTGRLATLRLQLPGASSATAEADLLFASCGIEAEIVAQAVERRLVGVGPVRVARVGHLIAMKLLSVRDARPNDRADLEGLMTVASRAELAEAQRAVKLIEERGFHRGRALVDELEHLMQAHRLRQQRGQGL